MFRQQEVNPTEQKFLRCAGSVQRMVIGSKNVLVVKSHITINVQQPCILGQRYGRGNPGLKTW